VAGDTNGVRDVFVRDMQTGSTVRIAGASGQPDGPSTAPRLSADGRFLALTSFADNLVPGDANRLPDIFRVNLAAVQIQAVSVAADGALGDRPSAAADISADGRFVAFSSWARHLTADDTNKWSDVFVRDMTNAHTSLASRTDLGGQVNNSSYAPSVSDDGTSVAFESAATNIVIGDKGARDVFVRNLATSHTYRVSGHTYQRVDGPSAAADLSGDGSTVVFQSSNWRLAGNGASAADVFSARPDGSDLRLVSAGGDQPSGFPSVSNDGRTVAFESASSTLSAGTAPGELHVYRATLSAG
jgi:Tol biopolymer transport system component